VLPTEASFPILSLAHECTQSPLPPSQHVRQRPSAPAGSGCLGCLSNKEWLVRKRAAETLLALGRLLGPDIETGCSERHRGERVMAYLRDIKHDRVKPTREAIAACLLLYEDLAAWMELNPVCAPPATFCMPSCPAWVHCLIVLLCTAGASLLTHLPALPHAEGYSSGVAGIVPWRRALHPPPLC
jgi:hypothetical protein